MSRFRKTNIRRVRDATLWRECGYCGATVRARYCSAPCEYGAQTVRDIEARGFRRKDVSRTSAWEDAARERRMSHVRRLVGLGCPIDIALLEAGFSWGERESAAQHLRRKGLQWPNPLLW